MIMQLNSQIQAPTFKIVQLGGYYILVPCCLSEELEKLRKKDTNVQIYIKD